MAKKRSDIPSEVAARVLFLHDRTCCVCRKRGKPVQIHHLDEDSANHDMRNLAVLCFDCHRDTQLRGGFDRKLDAEQIVLYREDWLRIVARERTAEEAIRGFSSSHADFAITRATSLAEIYREAGEYELLAIHYGVLGNQELRDKYIELAIKQAPTTGRITFLRGLQNRPDLIPQEVVERRLQQHDKYGDWEQKGRFLATLGRYGEAVQAYLRGISESLEQGNTFSPAFYLKELHRDGLIDRLLEIALREARERGDLWWQVRALQELGWGSELRELLLSKAEEITSSGDLLLQILLAREQGDEKRVLELEQAMARSTDWRDGSEEEESDE